MVGDPEVVAARLAKSLEAFDGASSEKGIGRLNNAANRAYYACFHAMVAALVLDGTQRTEWPHRVVMTEFLRLLVTLGVVPRPDVGRLFSHRLAADYNHEGIDVADVQWSIDEFAALKASTQGHLAWPP